MTIDDTLLATFAAAGVLDPVDVHTAAALRRLSGETQSHVLLAAALAVRAPRHGHVCADLRTVALSAVAETDVVAGRPGGAVGWSAVAALPWPRDVASWVAAVAASPLVQGPERALVLDGERLYLERYRAYESDVVEQIARRSRSTPLTMAVDEPLLASILEGEGSDEQRAAVRAALASRLTVLVGGPGTGKTRTVAALLALLLAEGDLDVALAAPTGKAAARLADAFRAMAGQIPAPLGERLGAARASTVHRLLGASAQSRTRFVHHAGHPLPHDVVIVDECSMVSLPLMARLLAAVRPDARLVLVGDPGQLASVEAGSVLGDLAGPIVGGDGRSDRHGPLEGRVAVLTHSRRFPAGSPIDRLARAVRAGDADAAIEVLSDPGSADAPVGSLRWMPHRADEPVGVEAVGAIVVPPALSVIAAASAGDASGALDGLTAVRLLCAHRHGPFGVGWWNARMERWLLAAGHRPTGWYAGRPVLVTANDPANDLFNGDLGVVVTGAERPLVAFPHVDAPRLVAPARLAEVETVHAMTIHKSQGSEFDHVVVVLPPADSRLATRELLYTAITRAQSRVTVVADEQSVRAAVERRVVRASGLSDRLWSSNPS